MGEFSFYWKMAPLGGLLQTNKLNKILEESSYYGRYPELNLIQLGERDVENINHVLSRELTKVGINVSGF